MGDGRSQQDIVDWDRIAGTYVQHGGVDDPMYLHLADALWNTLGTLDGLRVLDLGCGDGWLSQMMDAAGAQVVGVDGSEKLLALARSRCPHLEFIQTDLAAGIPPFPRGFDRIVSTMVLMDIPDLAALMRDVRLRLADGGRLVFVILHPCFFRYKIHFDEETCEWYRRVTNYQDPQVWRIDSFGGHNHYHRDLTYYAELLRANHMAITRLLEPEWKPMPDSEKNHVVRRWPLCLLIEARPLAIAP